MSTAKDTVSICVVGHSSSGKSTFCGRLLYDLGHFSEGDVDRANKFNSKCSKFSNLMHRTKQDREQGQSINYNNTRYFETPSYHIPLIDVPGNPHYIKNMISGTRMADAAILIVPATQNLFNQSIAKRTNINETEGACYEHLRICNVFGIKQLVVCINKLDEYQHCLEQYFNSKKETILYGFTRLKTQNTCNLPTDIIILLSTFISFGLYSQNRFDEIKNIITKILSKIGYISLFSTYY